MVHWQLLKGVLFISLAFCAFSVPFECKALLFFMSLAVSALLVAKTFYPAAVKTGIVAGMAILLNMAVWFVFHSVVAIIQTIGFLTFVIVMTVLFIILLVRVGRMVPASYGTFPPPTSYSYYQNGMLSINLYHGTPDLNNVRDIIDYGSGFIVGPGNSYGTGVYFTDNLEVAKQYVRGTGGIVRVNLHIPANQIDDYNSVVNSSRFRNWSASYGNGNTGDNVTEYTIGVLKKRYIRVPSYGVYIALAKATVGNERVTFEGITILGGFDALGNPI